jgi:hypothetical protein
MAGHIPIGFRSHEAFPLRELDLRKIKADAGYIVDTDEWQSIGCAFSIMVITRLGQFPLTRIPMPMRSITPPKR